MELPVGYVSVQVEMVRSVVMVGEPLGSACAFMHGVSFSITLIAAWTYYRPQRQTSVAAHWIYLDAELVES